MRVHPPGKPMSRAAARAMPAAALSPERRRVLHLLLGATLAASALAVAGCAATVGNDEAPMYRRRGSGNRGGDGGASHR
jgi:hypothetical protein